MGGQPQFYLEQDFPFHPKVALAGGDAAWLYVCGMAWATKHLTGRIPKALVPRLSDRKNVTTLSQRLVSAGLWIDGGDHFEIHDFETRNKKALAARRKAKHAAQARWEASEAGAGANAPSNAPSITQALPGECTSNALEPKNQRTKEPPPNPPPSLTVVRDDDSAAEDFRFKVVTLVAERQLTAAKARGKHILSESGWLWKAAESIEVEHAQAIRLAYDTSLSIEATVDAIEPLPKPKPRDPNSAYTTPDGRTFLPGTGWVTSIGVNEA